MKRVFILLLAAGIGFAAAGLIVSQRQAARHAAQLAELQAAWQTKPAELEAALERAREQALLASTPFPAPPASAPGNPAQGKP